MAEGYNIPELNSLDSMEGVDLELKLQQKFKNLLQDPDTDYSEILSRADLVQYDEDGHTGGAWWQANHGRMLDKLRPGTIMYEKLPSEIVELFKTSLSESTLCDLGSAGAKMDWLASAYNASLYISVDKFPNGLREVGEPIDPTIARMEIRRVRDMSNTNSDEKFPDLPLPTLHIRADMLDFLSRLKNSSANVVINGIDGDIIPPEEYHQALAVELLRVVKDGGLIFGNNSTCLGILRRMIDGNIELQRRFEIIDQNRHKLGVGGVVVIHKIK